MSPENDPLLRLWADQRAKQTRSSVGVLQVSDACPAVPVKLCTYPVSRTAARTRCVGHAMLDWPPALTQW